MHRCSRLLLLLSVLCLGLATLQVAAFIEPKNEEKAAGSLESLEFSKSDLNIPEFPLATLGQLPSAAASEANRDLIRMGIQPGSAFVDPLSGRFESLSPYFLLNA